MKIFKDQLNKKIMINKKRFQIKFQIYFQLSEALIIQISKNRQECDYPNKVNKKFIINSKIIIFKKKLNKIFKKKCKVFMKNLKFL